MNSIYKNGRTTKALLPLCLLASLLIITGCSSDDEAYDTAVTRAINITLDGNPWSIYYGTSGRPIFIYKPDGEYVAEYSSSYNFDLENGTYKVFALTNTELALAPTSLDSIVVPQDTNAAMSFAVSAPTDYTAGQEMNLDMFTRTGMLRLRSTDVKADKSYSSVRITLKSPVTGYRIGSASYIIDDNNPVVLTHSKASSNGGVNYSDDMILLGTQPDGRKVNVHLDYLDDEGQTVKSKDFDDDFEIVPNDTTVVSFALNNADEPVIIDYTVGLASEGWETDSVHPGAPLVIPDGYTYISPDEDLASVISSQMADDNVSEIQLYLKAGAAYTLPSNALSNLTKPLSIIGQTPARNQEKVSLSLGAIVPNGNLSEISFKNINFKAGSRFFNVRNNNFDITTLSFTNCEWNDWNGVIWYQNTTSATVNQHIGTFSLEGCILTNWRYNRSPLLGLPTRNPAKVDTLRLHNNNIEGNYTSTDAIYTNYDGTTLDLEGNNF